jgi:phosphatidylglycerol:prolipoprotein diacylglycerol transferase
MYLITYPIGRFLLDFLRLDAALVGGININQTIMLATALCSSLIIFFRHRKKSTQAASITSAAVDEDES